MCTISAARRIRLCAALLAVAIVTCGCGVRLQNLGVGRTVEGASYRLTVVFDDVSGLPIGGEVRLGPGTVGRVQSITTRDFQAYVHLRVRDEVRLPRGTRAALKRTTALGDQYLALQPPPGEVDTYLGDGATIPNSHTSRGPSIEDMLALFGNVLHHSGFEQARTIVEELNTMLNGRTRTVRKLLQRGNEILTTLQSRGAEFTRTVHALARLSSIVRDNLDTLESAFSDIGPAIDVLRANQDALYDLLHQVGSLTESTVGTLAATKDRIVGMVEDLRRVLHALRGTDVSIGDFLNSLSRLTSKITTAAPGDYLNLDVTFNVPATLRGLFTTAAPGTHPSGGPVDGGAGSLLRGGVR